MSVVFIHLSDIHFGQEKGGRVFTHADVRERLLDDVTRMVKNLPNGRVDGIIVSGDIAYAGQILEYGQAGQWLDRLASAAGCKITDIQVVPGNHDINRDGICRSSEMMLAEISEKGESRLDFFLELEKDREVFYGRFDAYREFAEAYDCPLDRDGGTAGERATRIGPDRTLRFIGLNSALCCAKKDEKGKLLLGARQRVLPRKVGEELVVICHHPLPWLRDSDEARQYVRSRARVFISGHEHTPQIVVDRIENGCDLLMIAAGATVPPVADEEFTFTYNVLEFAWDAATDGLTVKIHPRVWSPSRTAFEANTKLFGHDTVCKPPEQMTNHTEPPDHRTAGFLHLRLRDRKSETTDILLPDLPGEWSTSFVDSNRVDRLGFLKAADVIWLMIDGRQLIELPSRQQVLHRSSLLLQRISEFLGSNAPPVFIVISHRDLGNPSNASIQKLHAEAQRFGVPVKIVQVSSFSDNDLVAPGTGIAELVESSLASASAPSMEALWPDSEAGTTKRHLLKFRIGRVTS